MKTKINPKWGFDTVIVGSVTVYTCKITCDKDAQFPNIDGVSYRITQKWANGDCYPSKGYISYETTDFQEHIRMQREIMLFLEQHAMDRVKRKYAYLHY